MRQGYRGRFQHHVVHANLAGFVDSMFNFSNAIASTMSISLVT
jgi:hypothetical protein